MLMRKFAWTCKFDTYLISLWEVILNHPYLPCFISNLHNVQSVGLLASRASKWYIACLKMTSRSTLYVTSNSYYILLPNFEFQFECLNFKLSFDLLSCFFLLSNFFHNIIFSYLILWIALFSFVETFLMLHTFGTLFKHI